MVLLFSFLISSHCFTIYKLIIYFYSLLFLLFKKTLCCFLFIKYLKVSLILQFGILIIYKYLTQNIKRKHLIKKFVCQPLIFFLIIRKLLLQFNLLDVMIVASIWYAYIYREKWNSLLLWVCVAIMEHYFYWLIRQKRNKRTERAFIVIFILSSS